jgi:hypothetical protein
MTDRRAVIAGLGFVALALPVAARAHHGWSWTSDEEFSLEGILRTVDLGNPHGVLGVEAADRVWVAEVGQP